MFSGLDDELRQRLLNEIDTAFLNNRYPGDHGIGGKDVSVFRGKWQDISLETIIYNRSAISEFSTEGFAYYLPAFLKAIIVHTEAVDTLIYQVIPRLIPPKMPADRYLIKVMEELKPDQKLAIRDFFVAYEQLLPNEIGDYSVVNLHDLERAIKYWTTEAASK